MKGLKKILSHQLGRVWFHPSDFHEAVAYTVGLISSMGKPSLKILQSKTGIQAVNLSEFLRVEELGWEISTAFNGQAHKLPAGGELLTDTFVAPKEHTTYMGAYRVHSSSQKRILQGQQYAVLVWSLGSQTVVVGCREIAAGQKIFTVTLDLIKEFLLSGIEVLGVSADGFYSKPGFLKPLKELKLSLVSKPRRDSWWALNTSIMLSDHGEKIQLKQYANTLPIESFHYYQEQHVYAKSILVSSKEGIDYKVVFIRPRRSSPPQKWIYLLSTDTKMTTREIIKRYRRRWRIEVVFRDCSQNLGLKHHQGHSGSSERHVVMVFLTYNFLAELKFREGKTIGFLKRHLATAYDQERTTKMPYSEKQSKVA